METTGLTKQEKIAYLLVALFGITLFLTVLGFYIGEYRLLLAFPLFLLLANLLTIPSRARS